MMLAVENWETGSLEVAMLLDEAPNRHYLRGAINGAPWRPDGPLAEAARTADLYGYAWFTIVFQKDDVRTWGQKRVKVVSGGRIYAPVRTKAGVETGELRELGYEKLAPDAFDTVYGQESTLMYRVVQNAEMTLDPDVEADLGTPHDLLGYREERPANTPDFPSDTGKYVRSDLGCKIVWTDEKRYGETWFLQDADGFSRYRFELTEFQRRPFVKDVLVRLGFEKGGAATAATREREMKMHMRGHLQNVTESLRALAVMLADQGRAPENAGRAHLRKKEPEPTSPVAINGGRKNGKARANAAATAAASRVNAAVASAAAARNAARDEVVVLDIKDSDVERVTASESDGGDTMEIEAAAPDYMAQFEPSGS